MKSQLSFFALMALLISGVQSWAQAGVFPLLGGDDEAYFRQFLFQKETSDDGDGEIHVQWRFLMGSKEIQITPNELLSAQVNVFLMEDGTSDIIYREMFKVRADENSEWRYDLRRGGICPAVVSGKWTVPGKQLMLDDVAVGDRTIEHSQNAVLVTFAKAILSPALAGQSVVLSYGYSNSGEKVPPFCQSLPQ